jgi:osmotically-inducible protein OsmY
MKRDSEIQKDVMDELNWEPLLNAHEIGVAVKDGIVTLSGRVDTYTKKLKAEEAAKRIIGVTAVVVDIDVTIASFGKKSDVDIAEAAIAALKWNVDVPKEKIKVTVEDGWITLEGEVDWEYQKSAAKRAVHSLTSVKGVINNIKVVSLIAPKDVKNKIFAAFHRSATVDAERISILTEGSKVILSGKVRSYVEKRDAENAAWLAPGVNKVENNLAIDTEVLV